MNIGFLKLGSRLSWSGRDTTGGGAEAKAVIDILTKTGNTVTCYTKMLNGESSNPKEGIYVKDILQTQGQINDDILIVSNGSISLFGGLDDPYQIMNYIILNKFKGEVYYIWIDPELYLKQLWGAIKSKPWASNYKEEEITITRKINVITSIYNEKQAREKFAKGKVDNFDISFFNFEMFPLFINNSYALRPKSDPSCDLVYMGTFRSGRREKKIEKFYLGYDESVKVRFIGKIKKEDFSVDWSKINEPEWVKPVEYHEVNKKINDSLAHIVIGDKFYEGNILTPRIYEAMIARTVCLIDIDMDPNGLVFGKGSWFYIKNQKEVVDKLNQLRDKNFRLSKIKDQSMIVTSFEKEVYARCFVSLLTSNPK